MKLQIVSDLHLDAGNKPIISKTDADIIVLAGDVSRGFKAEYKFAVDLSRRHNKKVIIVNGNSSFYDFNMYEEQKKWRNTKTSEVIYLDHTTGYVADGVNFLGGTLWVDYTDKDDCYEFTNINSGDFNSIMVSTTSLFNQDISTHQHLLLLGHIEHNLSLDYKNVIITHHPPSYALVPKSEESQDYSCHLANSLENFISKNNIDVWIHGHSTNSFDYMLDSTRVVSNPYFDDTGKVSKINPNYRTSKLVDI